MELQSRTYVTLLSFMDKPFATGMTIISMLLEQSIWPPAVMKSRHFGLNYLINRFLLLMKWYKTHKSKYHTSLRAFISESLTILATSGRKGFGSELLSSTIAIYVRFMGLLVVLFWIFLLFYWFFQFCPLS